MNTTTPIFIYTETTPNPFTLKFVVNRILLADRSVEYLTAEDAKESPLALALFTHPFVASLYITRNFITITRHKSYEWRDVSAIAQEAIRAFLESDAVPFSQIPEIKSSAKPTERTWNEMESKIIEILNQYIRPAVELDGGEIAFKHFENGIVHLILKGSCSGCPSSEFTLKAGIEQMLCQMVPGVEGVMAENG